MSHCDWNSRPGSTSPGKQSRLSLPDHYIFGRLKLVFQSLTVTNLRKGRCDGFPSVPWHHMDTAPAYGIPTFKEQNKYKIFSRSAWWSMNTTLTYYYFTMHDHNVYMHADSSACSVQYVWCAKFNSPILHTISYWQSESGTTQKVLAYCLIYRLHCPANRQQHSRPPPLFQLYPPKRQYHTSWLNWFCLTEA